MAFVNCAELTSIKLPEAINTIGRKAFQSCSKLQTIILPNAITSLQQEVFLGCKSLSSIQIPENVTKIEYASFTGCSSLKSIFIPKNVNSISGSAFSTSSIQEIRIDENNSVYDSRENCNAIIKTSNNTLIFGCSTTTIPNSVTTIDDYAFSGCSGLADIVIPEGVRSIKYRAFYNCEKLKKLSIASSVTNIGQEAFYNCVELKEIYSYIQTPFALDKSVFNNDNWTTFNIYKVASLFVPHGAQSTYKSTWYWSLFDKMYEMEEETGIHLGMTEESEVLRYNISGLKMNLVAKGINIVRMSDGTTKKVVVK